MKYLLLFLSVLIFSNTFGQDRYGNPQNGVFDNNLDFFAMAKVENKSNSNFIEGVEGTIYLNKTWEKCYIKSTKKDADLSIQCNYNVYEKQFEIIIDKDMYILNPESIASIQIGQKTFIPTIHSTDNNYYEQLADGKSVKLVKLYKAKVKTEKTNTLGLFEQRLVIRGIDYFLKDDDTFVKVPTSKSKIIEELNLTSDQKKDYKKYNLKKTDQLIEVIESLQE